MFVARKTIYATKLLNDLTYLTIKSELECTRSLLWGRLADKDATINQCALISYHVISIQRV